MEIQNQPKKPIFFGLIVLVIIGVAVILFIQFKKSTPTTNQQSQNQSSNNQTPAEQAAQLSDPSTQIDLSSLNFNYKEDKLGLAQVPNLPAVEKKYGLKLTSAQNQFLADNQFLLIDLNNTNFQHGINYDDWLNDYGTIGGASFASQRNPEDTKLITPDVMLHAYHKFFDLTLQQLEEKELTASLGDFLTGITSNLSVAVKNNSGTLKTRYQNLLAEMLVARVVFENKSPAKPAYFNSSDEENAYNDADKTIDTYANAQKIFAKYSLDLTPDLATQALHDIKEIYDAKNPSGNSLFTQYNQLTPTDYTQFTPRSHYTQDSTLRAYFRAMMYLGRSAYFLKNDVGIQDSNLLVNQFKVKTQDGIVPYDDWKKIMDVTGFYAGQSDDLTYTEWQQYLVSQLGSDSLPASDLISDSNVARLAKNLNQLPEPKILSDIVITDNINNMTKADLLRQSLGFRVFGQRFTFDAWVLNDLTAGQEQTDVKLPSTPSALFVPAAMGDTNAAKHSQEFLSKDWGFTPDQINGFMTKLQQKQADISKVTFSDWMNSFGSGWLYVLGSLTTGYDSKYPLYMQSSNFADKQLQTFLGSYTELKHDTLLYAKQSYAEKGGGAPDAPPNPIVKGFVEPNINFWNRFGQLLDQTEKVYVNLGVGQNNTAISKLQEFKQDVGFYAGLAKKELEGTAITDDEYEKLRNLSLTFMADPLSPNKTPDNDTGKIALIADVHTDADKGQVLYEATGKPYLILVLVGNEQTPRAVVGLVYNQYEFTGPLGGNRLTDQDWQSKVYDHPSQLPAKNFWYSSLINK